MTKRRHRARNRSVADPRERAWLQQGGRCAVCECPIWLRGVETREAFIERLQKTTGKLSGQEKKRLQETHLCTLDHFIPKSQGGQDSDPRNKALCKPCNRARGDTRYDIFYAVHRWNLGFR